MAFFLERKCGVCPQRDWVSEANRMRGNEEQERTIGMANYGYRHYSDNNSERREWWSVGWVLSLYYDRRSLGRSLWTCIIRLHWAELIED